MLEWRGEEFRQQGRYKRSFTEWFKESGGNKAMKKIKTLYKRDPEDLSRVLKYTLFEFCSSLFSPDQCEEGNGP